LGDPPKPNAQLEDPEEMAVATEAREHRMFAGRLERSELTMKERTIVKMVRAPYGDFRDWAAIRSWARGIGNELNPSTSVERRRAS
jgi:menaquinone-dependent protoporphyrinogen oxidase